jgi:hypothetical protein
LLIMLGKRSLKLVKFGQLILQLGYLNIVLKKVLVLLTRHNLRTKDGSTDTFNDLL